MPYIQNTENDQRAMLNKIGVGSIEELFEPIPAQHRLQGALPIDPGLTESELLELCKRKGSWNRPATERPCFLGGGVYNHGWPTLVDHLMQRSEFLTAYTPYQPECSQGSLQWIYEFQSMIAEICGMEVANASMYDGASACAEAALMALGIKRRKKVVVSAGLHPHSKDAIRTYLKHQDVDVVEAPLVDGRTSWENSVDDQTAAVFVQQPNFLGLIEDMDAPVQIARQFGAVPVASVYPVALGLLRSPGQAGFEIVVGDGQSLGVPIGYGGPFFGFFATLQKHVRRMPGRLVGTSVDRQERRAYTLTFQTREQHIRREKATSNICTNNSLIALRGCVHMAALGPKGLEEVACVSRQRALDMQQALDGISGLQEAFPKQAFFNEIPYRASGGEVAIRKLKNDLQAEGIAAVLSMRPWHPDLEGVFTLACTERTTEDQIKKLAALMANSLQMEMAV